MGDGGQKGNFKGEKAKFGIIMHRRINSVQDSHLDEDDRVHNAFWVDGAARTAYKTYNDCISFDTTYMTNMPRAPFVGINRHGQSIQLGCGFLRNEKIDSFVWLFEAFLDAMDGVAPVNMITDQDPEMKAAIQQVFPMTVHRNCRWHIMKKVQDKIGNFMARRDRLRQDFNVCVDNVVSVEQFGHKWNQMISKHQVADNVHQQHLWGMRTCWVPVYYKDCFFPFLQTTAQSAPSEGFNAVLKMLCQPTQQHI